jgi:hypothetical protein
MNQEMMLGIVRHVLTIAGGAAASAGVVTEADVPVIVGALSALAGVVWSIVAKRRKSA